MKPHEVQLRSASDADFRAQLIDNPKKTLAKCGIELPDSVSIRIEQATTHEYVFALPPLQQEGTQLSEEQLAATIGGWGLDFSVANMQRAEDEVNSIP